MAMGSGMEEVDCPKIYSAVLLAGHMDGGKAGLALCLAGLPIGTRPCSPVSLQ